MSLGPADEYRSIATENCPGGIQSGLTWTEDRIEEACDSRLRGLGHSRKPPQTITKCVAAWIMRNPRKWRVQREPLVKESV